MCTCKYLDFVLHQIIPYLAWCLFLRTQRRTDVVFVTPPSVIMNTCAGRAEIRCALNIQWSGPNSSVPPRLAWSWLANCTPDSMVVCVYASLQWKSCLNVEPNATTLKWQPEGRLFRQVMSVSAAIWMLDPLMLPLQSTTNTNSDGEYGSSLIESGSWRGVNTLLIIMTPSYGASTEWCTPSASCRAGRLQQHPEDTPSLRRIFIPVNASDPQPNPPFGLVDVV